MKVQTPLKLTDYQIINSKKKISLEQVDSDLRDMLSWMKTQENTYLLSADYDSFVEKLVSGDLKPKGSLQGWAREYLAPPVNYKQQLHNTSEMFRQQVMEKSAGYVQKCALYNIFASFTEKPEYVKEIQDAFVKKYPHLSKPTSAVLLNEIARYYDKGFKNTKKPSAVQTLKLYACDMKFSRAKLYDGFIVLNIVLPTGKMTELLFKVPDKERFKGEKVSRPTIRINKKDQVEFVFTIQKEVKELDTEGRFLGVDIGKEEPFVASVIDVDSKTHSAPIYVNAKINKQQEEINGLFKLNDLLYQKALRCEDAKHLEKKEILLEEKRRVRNKISRLKKEQTIAIANQIVAVALERKAAIVVENLRWLRAKGGKWNHAEIHAAIESRAAREGIPVKRISAKNTSQKCSDCGGKLTKYANRRVKCVKCTAVINRDVSASREIARRAGKVKFLKTFRQENSASTRMSYPVLSRKSSDAGIPNGENTLLKGENGNSYSIGKYSNCRNSKT